MLIVDTTARKRREHVIKGKAKENPPPTSVVGQSRRFDDQPTASDPPRITDIIRSARLVRFVPEAGIRVISSLSLK